MTSLASLNGRDGIIVADLDWFFNESQDDLGVSSNFPQMVARIQLGLGRGTEQPVSYDMDGRLVALATRARVITRRLQSIGRHAFVLKAWMTEPPGGLKEFGELAGIVVLAARDVGFVGDDPHRAASMLVDLCRDKPELKELILREAEQMRRAACAAYSRSIKEKKPCPES